MGSGSGISPRKRSKPRLVEIVSSLANPGLRTLELMLLIPIMGMDNARPVRRFIGKEDHFTNLLFHGNHFYAEQIGVGSIFHVGILHD